MYGRYQPEGTGKKYRPHRYLKNKTKQQQQKTNDQWSDNEMQTQSWMKAGVRKITKKYFIIYAKGTVYVVNPYVTWSCRAMKKQKGTKESQ